MKALTWIWDHKLALGLALLGVAALLFRLATRSRGGPDPFDAVKQELKTIDAVREARQARIDLGEEQALQQVKEKYAERREQMDAKEVAEIDRLAADPVALARAMERASR